MNIHYTEGICEIAYLVPHGIWNGTDYRNDIISRDSWSWLSDSRFRLSAGDLGASDCGGLQCACDYDTHSNHTLQVCENYNSTAHSTQELNNMRTGLRASPPLR